MYFIFVHYSVLSEVKIPSFLPFGFCVTVLRRKTVNDCPPHHLKVQQKKSKQTFAPEIKGTGYKIRDSLRLAFFGFLEKKYETRKDFVGKSLRWGYNVAMESSRIYDNEIYGTLKDPWQ